MDEIVDEQWRQEQAHDVQVDSGAIALTYTSTFALGTSEPPPSTNVLKFINPSRDVLKPSPKGLRKRKRFFSLSPRTAMWHPISRSGNMLVRSEAGCIVTASSVVAAGEMWVVQMVISEPSRRS